MERKKQIDSLEKRIDDLKKRFPAHSLKPRMLQELEQMEEELGNLLAGADPQSSSDAGNREQ